MARFNQRAQLAVEECQQQGGNMLSVHVGIGHKNNFMVAQFGNIKPAFPFAYARTHGGNQVAHGIAGQDFHQRGFFHV